MPRLQGRLGTPIAPQLAAERLVPNRFARLRPAQSVLERLKVRQRDRSDNQSQKAQNCQRYKRAPCSSHSIHGPPRDAQCILATGAGGGINIRKSVDSKVAPAKARPVVLGSGSAATRRWVDHPHGRSIRDGAGRSYFGDCRPGEVSHAFISSALSVSRAFFKAMSRASPGGSNPASSCRRFASFARRAPRVSDCLTRRRCNNMALLLADLQAGARLVSQPPTPTGLPLAGDDGQRFPKGWRSYCSCASGVKKSPTRGAGFAGRATAQEAAGEASPTTSNVLEGLLRQPHCIGSNRTTRTGPFQISTVLLSASTFTVSFASSSSTHVRVCRSRT